MEEQEMKKIICLIVVTLLITLCIITTNASDPLPLKKSIYVNDDNTQGPWLGTLDNPYRYIQDAIDNAVADDIIYVANGTYYEHLIIPSNLNGLSIQHWTDAPGDNDNIPPTLNGNSTGTAISIFASRVKITQLFITDYGKAGQDAGISVETNANKVNLNYLIINDTHTGIIVQNSSFVTIFSSTITNCRVGIHLYLSYRCYISTNIIHDIKEIGILLQDTITNTLDGFIQLSDSDNQVSENQINYGRAYGVAFWYSIGNYIEKNDFIGASSNHITFINGLRNYVSKNNFAQEPWYIKGYIHIRNLIIPLLLLHPPYYFPPIEPLFS
jgi:parallel beta-helix repeat protein